MSYLTIDDLKSEAIVELYNSAQCLEEFCAHMSCETCVLYFACNHIDNHSEDTDCMYHLMHAVKDFIRPHIRG